MVFRASLIVLLLVIMGLLLKVAFKTSTGPTDNLEVVMELSRLRLQAARNEELMMRLYESMGERKPEAFKAREEETGAGIVIARKISKVEEMVRQHEERVMMELRAIQGKLADQRAFSERVAESFEGFKASMSSMLTPLKDLTKWF